MQLVLFLLWTNMIITDVTGDGQIQIHDLTNNPGLVSLQLGNGRIRIGSHRIFHIIDTTFVEPILEKLRLNFQCKGFSCIAPEKKNQEIVTCSSRLMAVAGNRCSVHRALSGALSLANQQRSFGLLIPCQITTLTNRNNRTRSSG